MPTDKQRLDFMTRKGWSLERSASSHRLWWIPGAHGMDIVYSRTPRRAIDAAMKAEAGKEVR